MIINIKISESIKSTTGRGTLTKFPKQPHSVIGKFLKIACPTTTIKTVVNKPIPHNVILNQSPKTKKIPRINSTQGKDQATMRSSKS